MAGDLLQDDGRLDVAEPQTTPLLADGDPEQVGGGQGLQRLLGQLAAEVGVPGPRGHRPVPDVAGQGPQRLAVLRLGEGVDASGRGHGEPAF